MGNFESHSSTEFGLDLSDLSIDQAYVIYKSNLNRPVHFYSLADECVECLPELQLSQAVSVEENGIIETKYNLDMFAGWNGDGVNLTKCLKHEAFLEFGVYNCSVDLNNDDQTLVCHCAEAKAGVDIYWPIICCCAFYLVVAILWMVGKYLFHKYKSRLTDCDVDMQITDNGVRMENVNAKEPGQKTEDASTSGGSADEQPKKPPRIKSVDTFRGIAISIMIFVNYGAGDYVFLDHAVWNGLHLADLVFPWFMWLMGVCIPISMRSLLRRKKSKSLAFVKVVKRSIFMFFLGLSLTNTGPFVDVQLMRIFGVLQRFGVTYLIVASVHLAFLKLNQETSYKKFDVIKDIIDILPQWIIVLLMVFIHLIITLLLKLGDCPRGYLGPGGRHNSGENWNCTGGVTGYIDRMILGDKHVYQNPTAKAVYDGTLPFDPEGLVGTLQACFSVFLGVQAGMIILMHKSHKGRVIRWLSWALVTGCLGALLCKASRDDGWIPVNKNLWSVTFVLVTACLAFIILALCYLVIDVMNFWDGAPFFYAGMNSILLYVGHQLTYDKFPWRWINSSSGSIVVTHGYQLVVDLWGATLWVVISIWLYYIKFFLTL